MLNLGEQGPLNKDALLTSILRLWNSRNFSYGADKSGPPDVTVVTSACSPQHAGSPGAAAGARGCIKEIRPAPKFSRIEDTSQIRCRQPTSSLACSPRRAGSPETAAGARGCTTANKVASKVSHWTKHHSTDWLNATSPRHHVVRQPTSSS